MTCLEKKKNTQYRICIYSLRDKTIQQTATSTIIQTWLQKKTLTSICVSAGRIPANMIRHSYYRVQREKTIQAP